MRYGLAIAGGILAVLSIISTVFFAFPYWYSFLLVGSFVLFGACNAALGGPSVYGLLLQGRLRDVCKLYFAGAVFGFLVDVLFGRMLAKLWYYPFLPGAWNYLIPILIYYPIAAFQLYELFYLIRNTLSRWVTDKHHFPLHRIFLRHFARFLAVLLPFCAAVSLIAFLATRELAQAVALISMVFTIFSFDGIYYLQRGKSMLFDVLQGSPLMLLTLLVSWLIGVAITELPNTFSWEWIYTIPFISIEFLRVNVLIFTFGWFFLVFVPVRYIDVVRAALGIDKR
jgi:hypothetical protein